jgi:hypothetical protein
MLYSIRGLGSPFTNINPNAFDATPAAQRLSAAARKVIADKLGADPADVRMTADPDVVAASRERRRAREQGAGGDGAGVTDEGRCLAQAYVAATGVTDSAFVAQLEVAASSNPAQFKQALKEGGVSFQKCVPWYKRKSTLLLGGGAVAILAVVGLTR